MKSGKQSLLFGLVALAISAAILSGCDSPTATGPCLSITPTFIGMTPAGCQLYQVLFDPHGEAEVSVDLVSFGLRSDMTAGDDLVEVCWGMAPHVWTARRGTCTSPPVGK